VRLVDLDQTIFVPVVDETHGGVTVEMKMSVGEFFGKFCQGFEPEVVEAVPVEWLWAAQNKMLKSPRYNFEQCAVVGQLIRAWQKEQEAR
jgi:hypothetical protein